MKNSIARWMIAAAALVVAAGSAPAQTLTAEIPMAFKAGRTTMDPGNYLIRVVTGSAVDQIAVFNLDTKQSVLLVAGVKADAPKEWKNTGDAKLAFTCFGSNCSLSRVWSGLSTYDYEFFTSERPTMQARRAEVITLAAIRVK